MTDDRNLLFGVLAVQLDYINPGQLAEACAVWATRKALSLRGTLLEREWITEEEAHDIDRFLERRLRNSNQSCTDLLSRAVSDEQLRSDDSDEAWRSISELMPSTGYVLGETLDFRPMRRHRYTITRLHSAGGLGRVWLARDPVLNREVALKDIRPDKRSQEDAAKRFIREAQITGQLEHPNIVPVHELNRENDSIFYTMRFMRGRTFRDVIKTFHQKDQPRNTRHKRLRDLLTAFIAVCNAVEYAHSRAVVHRDLKPSNVVLGSFGEVVVLDWGLAKMVGEEDDDDDLPSVIVDGITAGDVTQEGQAVGTLGYMAPEQAKGRRRKIDKRTDIYALGATLYEILTAQPPHRGKDTLEILDKIAKRPTPRVRSVAPLAPAALDAICAKAMAKRRAHRYQSARELADDVERWLADEPVSVHRDSIGIRLARWSRRNRAWAQSIAASLLLVTLVSVGAAVAVRSAWHEERVARREADAALLREQEAKNDALKHFDESLRTIDTMLTGVSDVLRYYPGAQRLRSRLLLRAAGAYERLAAEDNSDPALQLEAARAAVRLADVHRMLGKHQQALDRYEEALEKLRTLPADLDDSPIEMEIALCLHRMGQSRGNLDLHDDAKRDLSAALEVAAANESKEFRHLKAKIQLSTALVQDRANQLQEAEGTIAEAEQELRSLKNSDANDEKIEADLALAQSMKGDVLCDLGDYEQGCRHLEEAVETYQKLAQQNPDNPNHLEGLAFSRIHLAEALRTLGRDKEQLEALIKAADDLEALLKTMPDVPLFRENLAVTLTNLGRGLHEQGRSEDARRVLDEALREFQNLFNSRSRQPRHVSGCATACVVLADVLVDLAQPTAEDNLRTAHHLFEDLIKSDDKNGDYHHGLAFCKRTYARWQWGNENHEEAIASLKDAIEEYEFALQLRNTDMHARDGLATAWELLGDIHAEQPNSEEAQACYTTAKSIRDELPNYPHFSRKLPLLASKIDASVDE